MNYPHLHLMLNHLPVLGSVFALALVAWALLRGSRELLRVALVATLVAGVSVVPAYQTGEEAHEQVEDAPGFDHDATEEHEEAAELGRVVLLLTGGLALLGLWLGRGERAVPGWAKGAVLAGLVASSAVMARTAWIGGEIRHPEVQGPLTSPPVLPSGGETSGSHAEGEHSH